MSFGSALNKENNKSLLFLANVLLLLTLICVMISFLFFLYHVNRKKVTVSGRFSFVQNNRFFSQIKTYKSAVVML